MSSLYISLKSAVLGVNCERIIFVMVKLRSNYEENRKTNDELKAEVIVVKIWAKWNVIAKKERQILRHCQEVWER